MKTTFILILTLGNLMVIWSIITQIRTFIEKVNTELDETYFVMFSIKTLVVKIVLIITMLFISYTLLKNNKHTKAEPDTPPDVTRRARTPVSVDVRFKTHEN